MNDFMQEITDAPPQVVAVDGIEYTLVVTSSQY
jgi:hypothetical protein